MIFSLDRQNPQQKFWYESNLWPEGLRTLTAKSELEDRANSSDNMEGIFKEVRFIHDTASTETNRDLAAVSTSTRECCPQ